MKLEKLRASIEYRSPAFDGMGGHGSGDRLSEAVTSIVERSQRVDELAALYAKKYEEIERSIRQVGDDVLEEVLELFKLPRELGEFESHKVLVNNGRFGPYVLCNKKYVSVPKDKNIMTITLEEAIDLIEKKRQADEASHLKSFEEDPKMEIRNGRFGPYISYDGTNYRLPKALATKAGELTLEQCREIVTKQPAAKSRRPMRRTASRKKA